MRHIALQRRIDQIALDLLLQRNDHRVVDQVLIRLPQMLPAGGEIRAVLVVQGVDQIGQLLRLPLGVVVGVSPFKTAEWGSDSSR